ncbi:TonB-dependent receptor family protein [Chitinilyticum piscinae]|uniref:TonB-dependent receptor n=1 Tax=Chitinilyticum piscinae TaxID=2866724 RepID=A0A8J7FY07_9NEIS|nr:TonB-dependent receptor [Chitinilyticum piscinae]MBE9608540.1 TonB-dependent receptor [Chitinilyticum piscinae]
MTCTTLFRRPHRPAILGLRPLYGAFLAALPLLAQADPTTVLDEVVVTATREAGPLATAPISIGLISEKTIIEIKPTFIGQVLDKIPGVHMPDLGNEQHNMSIRQPMSYSAVYQYLEDGIPIRPVGIFNHNALYEINLPSAGGIEVLRGPASSLYGSNAVGGAVNFTSAAPTTTPLFESSFQGSNQGYRRLDVTASNSRDDSGLRIAGYVAHRGNSWQDYSSMDKSALTLRADHWISDTILWKNLLSYSALDTDMPGSLNETDYNSRPGYSYQSFTYRDVAALRASTTLEGEFNPQGYSSATLYVRNNRTDQLPSYLIFNTGPDSARGRTTENRFQSLGLSAFHRQQWGNFRATLGTLLERSPNDQSETNLNIRRDPLTGKYLDYQTGAVRRDYHVDLGNAALYADFGYQISPDFGINAGARYDRVSYDYTNALPASATTGAPSQTQSFAQTSPKFGFTWAASKAAFVYGGYSRGFTPPEISSLFGSAVRPDLQSATFDQLELGLRLQPLAGLKLDAAIYRLEGQDELVNYSLAPGRSEPRNAGRTRHEGLELGVNWQFAESFSAALAGQYARHIYLEYQPSAVENYAGKDIPAAPRWQGTFELAYRPSAQLRIALETAYLGKYWMDNRNMVSYAGHTLLNLRSEFQWHNWTLWAQALNLGNVHYAEMAASSYKGMGAHDGDTQDSYTPGAPRSVFIGLAYRFAGPKGAQ